MFELLTVYTVICCYQQEIKNLTIDGCIYTQF